MNIVVFGLGQHYQKNKQRLSELPTLNIIALSDNNSSLWGQIIDTVEVLPPAELQNIDCDYIVVTSWLYIEPIKEQLQSYGILKSKIMDLKSFLGYIEKGDMQVYFSKTIINFAQKRILFISTDLAYNGGSLAIVYAAMASKSLGLLPVILVPYADVNLVNEFTKKGLTFIVYSNLKQASLEELYWVEGYSYYVVNTFQMMLCASELAKKYSVIWWLHEPKIHYEKYKDLFEKCSKEMLNKLYIYSVTDRAKANFEENISFGVTSQELLLGIPETLSPAESSVKQNKKMIFTVVGGISKIKGQDILLEALATGKLSAYEDVEYWLIGNVPKDDYAEKVMAEVQKYPQVKVLGQKTRKEIEQLYNQIDILIVCSRDETLSIVAIEAMMYKKVCIVSDACGIVDYLEGTCKELVYPWEDVNALAEKILWCITNRKQLSMVGEEGRSIYEQRFSMDAFKERFRNVLELTNK